MIVGLGSGWPRSPHQETPCSGAGTLPYPIFGLDDPAPSGACCRLHRLSFRRKRGLPRGRNGMHIDRRRFIEGLGGAAAVALMTSEQKADALEAYMEEELDAAMAGLQQGGAPPKFPTMAEI